MIQREYYYESEIKSGQIGGAFFYGKKWNNGARTHSRLAGSQLGSEFNNYSKTRIINDSSDFSINSNKTQNHTGEYSLKIDHLFPARKNHTLNLGAALIQNTTRFQQDSIQLPFEFSQQELRRIDLYAKERIRITRHLSLLPGLKLALPLAAGLKPGFQPRIRLTFTPNQHLSFDVAAGIYKQYVAENAIIDQFDNYLYFWSVANGNAISELSSQHFVGGIRYHHSGFEFKSDIWYKTISEMSRFVSPPQSSQVGLSKGKGQTYGIDFFLKKQFKKHEIWLAYTLNKVEEKFDYFDDNEWKRAPHDQRHEVKCAGIFNFYPYFLSFNYVHGSGFPNTIRTSSSLDMPVYNRLDVAVSYRHQFPKAKFSTGLSISNLFNQPNFKYNNFSNFPDNRSIHSPGIPFSPTAFVGLQF